jgi:hypothetical protein
MNASNNIQPPPEDIEMQKERIKSWQRMNKEEISMEIQRIKRLMMIETQEMKFKPNLMKSERKEKRRITTLP